MVNPTLSNTSEQEKETWNDAEMHSHDARMKSRYQGGYD